MVQQPSTICGPFARQSSDAASAVQQPPLLEAPAEVRLKVYQALFDGAQIKLRASLPLLHGCEDGFEDDEKVTSVLRVCRLLRKEAQHVYFSTATFLCAERTLENLLVDQQRYGDIYKSNLMVTDLRRIEKLVIRPPRFSYADKITVAGALVWELWSLRELTWYSKWTWTTGCVSAPSITKLRESESLRREQFGALLEDTDVLVKCSKAVVKSVAERHGRPQKLSHGVMRFKIRYVSNHPDASAAINRLEARLFIFEQRTEIKLVDGWYYVPQKVFDQV
ncbi:uncharacterized protein AB675_1369 [Cyphellophora attinorum]|uniref:F-box domain-containing protein n=1 Tax=Cyphellophora attinorum TaxID=1664694 RepID=A0A0N1H3P8_9EURO|nr:uncharacterized protein AB675_1369 [Phialophora attinorum]KPI35090.1 hypothetical protein AB675_1369 [Phialophora attinorum]